MKRFIALAALALSLPACGDDGGGVDDMSTDGGEDESSGGLRMKPDTGDFCADMQVDLFPPEEFPDALSLSLICEDVLPIQSGGYGQDFTEFLYCLQGGDGYEVYSQYEVTGETGNISRDCWRDAFEFCANCI